MYRVKMTTTENGIYNVYAVYGECAAPRAREFRFVEVFDLNKNEECGMRNFGAVAGDAPL